MITEFMAADPLDERGPIEYRIDILDDPETVKSDHIVTSVTVRRVGPHDVVTVWNRGARAGSLTVKAGDGRRIGRTLVASLEVLNPDRVNQELARISAGDA